MAKEIANNLVIFLDKVGKYYFFLITAALYFCVLTLPEYAFGDFSMYIRYFITYIVINIIGNYYLCIKQGYYRPAQNKETLPGASWSFCEDCQQIQPPRCHHCPLCHRCILKRDHHCFFISTCVGQDNQANFAVYCFHASVGLLLSFAVLSHYLSASYYEVFSLDFYYYFPLFTLLNCLLGRVDIGTFFRTILLCGSFFTGICTMLLFLWQLFLISFDLTSHEVQQLWHSKGAGLSKMKTQVWYNMNQSFGIFPLLLFVLPIPLRFRRSSGSIMKSYL